MEPMIVDESSMPPELDAAIRAGLCACFPKDREHFAAGRDWHGSRPAFSAVVQEGVSVVASQTRQTTASGQTTAPGADSPAQVIAHAGVVDRVIEAGGVPLRVAGVQNVFVVPARRGTGLVHRVMKAAMAEAARRGLDCGLLFCSPALVKVYARTGWRPLPPAPITRVDAAGRELPLPAGNVAMFFPLARADFPPGDIHLRGNDW